MSLVNCPECGKEISDKAISCPYCGYPMAAHRVVIKSNETIDEVRTSIQEKMSLNETKETNKYLSILKRNIVPRVAIIMILFALFRFR